ncbi:MAG: LysM peptidoglycan-binding domain-containing protein [Candidatus Flexifilum sp.]|jgi:LysM repeat protein
MRHLLILGCALLLIVSLTAQTPTPEPPIAALHTVAPGDTLGALALRYNVPVEHIQMINGLSDPDALEVGRTLVIPISGFTFPTFTPAPPTAPPPLVPTIPIVLTADPNAPPALPLDLPTAQLLPTLTATPIPPLPPTVNGIPIEQIIQLPPDVVANIRAIHAYGMMQGLVDPHAFSKLGDSTIESPFFMDRFDQPGSYNLGDYGFLQGAIDHFRGSFARDSVAVRVGLHSWSIFDSMWSDARCAPGETLIACEFRLHRPAYLFIRLGANDVGVPGYFESSMRQIAQYAIEHGVIPIIGTKPDLREGTINNTILRQIAADLRVPLWDFELVAATVPGRGLEQDGVHLNTFYAHDWRLPDGFRRGHGLHSLTGLIALDRVWRAVADPAAATP